jgi:hypothetical protein
VSGYVFPRYLPVNRRLRELGRLGVEHGLVIWGFSEWAVLYGLPSPLTGYVQAFPVSDQELRLIANPEYLLQRLARKLRSARLQVIDAPLPSVPGADVHA